MDIMVSLHSAARLEQLKGYKVTHVMFNDERFASGNSGLSNTELASAIQKAHDLDFKAVVRVDRLYDQRELEDLKKYLVLINESKADAILFSDVTVKVLIDKLHLNVESIYAPETLLTNKYDVAQLQTDSFSSCVISKDIPLVDVYDIAEYNPGYCFVRVHGPILISYSKRRFISVYFNDYKQYTDNYYLQEESRTVKLPVIEKESGSWVYGYTLESFDQIKDIYNKPFRGVIIDNMLNEDVYTLKCLELYDAVLNDTIPWQKALEEIKKMDEAIEYTSINDIKKTFLEKE